MILFDERKFIAAEGYGEYERNKDWVKKCHGKEVVNDKCGCFIISPNWTVDTDDLVFSLEEYKKTLDIPGSWANYCDGQPVTFNGRLYVEGTDGGIYLNNLEWCVEKSKWTDSKVVKSKYQVGDKVIVRTDLELNTLYGVEDFVDTMARYKGKVVTITGVSEDGNKYWIAEDAGEWCWTDEMFSDVAPQVVPKQLLKTGDVVVTRERNKYLVVIADHRAVLMNEVGVGYMTLARFNDNLELETGNSDYDVMAIHRPTLNGFESTFKRIGESNLIWKREEQANVESEPESEAKSEEAKEAVEEFVKDLINLLGELVK